LYIGKALHIRNRVKNHFQQPTYRDGLFIDKITKIGFIETGSEIEALILEASLIKKYQPRFNVVWRDDKNYFYVVVQENKNGVPYVFVTHQPQKSRIQSASWRTKSKTNSKFKILNSKFQYIGPFVEGNALKKTLRFLRRAFPYYTNKEHSKIKCTYCHLGLCPGPELFEKPPSPEASAGQGEYEKSIKKLISILRGKRPGGYPAVLNSLKKEMQKLSKGKKFEEAAKIRDRIYNLQQVMSHSRAISDSNETAVNFTTAKFTAVSPWDKTQKILRGLTRLNKKISRIECYDVSNMQGKSATGSMAVFINGKSDKNQYRKFRIRAEEKPNDIAMLKEILKRRFPHEEWRYPEIILIDGGRAQLNTAIKIKNRRPDTKRIKVISIAKHHKELYIEGVKRPVALKSLPREIYNLILQLDDEAHRFAIAYHRKLRKKSLLQ